MILENEFERKKKCYWNNEDLETQNGLWINLARFEDKKRSIGKKLARVLDPKFRENVYKSRVLGKKTVRFSESVETRTFENTLEDREARINPQWRNNLRLACS